MARERILKTTVEASVYDVFERLTDKEGVSLSTKLRDIILDYLELYEDIELEKIGVERLKEHKKGEEISHQELKKRLGLK